MKQLIIYWKDHILACIFTYYKIYINIIYLPFHTVQFSDYKQYTIVKYRRNVKIANNEAVSWKIWKQAANALVARQPGVHF